jgi:hypothetical protein
VVAAAGDLDADQLVAVVQADRDQPFWRMFA